MTHVADLPKSLQNGTLTCCRQCGRLAIFAEPNRKSASQQDIWTCACLTENVIPTRVADESARDRKSSRSVAASQTPKEER